MDIYDLLEQDEMCLQVVRQNYDLKMKIIELQNKIDKANEVLGRILVIKRYDGNYGAVKNTTKQEVYEAICMLNKILDTPFRAKD